MVTEYHLNLGPKDTLESLVTLIKQKNPELKSKEEKTLIIDFLKNTEDKELISKKRALTYNVPYRLQSPFLENLKGKDWNVGETKLIEKINQENRLIYYSIERSCNENYHTERLGRIYRKKSADYLGLA